MDVGRQPKYVRLQVSSNLLGTLKWGDSGAQASRTAAVGPSEAAKPEYDSFEEEKLDEVRDS
jgi:hypothetical protein